MTSINKKSVLEKRKILFCWGVFISKLKINRNSVSVVYVPKVTGLKAKCPFKFRFVFLEYPYSPT